MGQFYYDVYFASGDSRTVSGREVCLDHIWEHKLLLQIHMHLPVLGVIQQTGTFGDSGGVFLFSLSHKPDKLWASKLLASCRLSFPGSFLFQNVSHLAKYLVMTPAVSSLGQCCRACRKNMGELRRRSSYFQSSCHVNIE